MGRTIDIQYNNAQAIENAGELKLSVLLESDSFFYWATNERNEVLRIEQVDGTDLTPLKDLGASKLNISFSHDIGYLLPGELNSDGLNGLFAQLTGVNTDWESYSMEWTDEAKLYIPAEYLSFDKSEDLASSVIYRPMARYFLFPGFIDTEVLQDAIVHLHFMEDKVFLAVYRGGKLLLWQVVPLSSPYELQYFTLLVYNQFHMDRQQVPLLLSGRIAAGSQMYHLLYPYFSKIQWAQLQGLPNSPVMPGTIPAHYLADLWLIHQCA